MTPLTTQDVDSEIRDLYFTDEQARTALPQPVSKPTWARWRKEGSGPPVTWVGSYRPVAPAPYKLLPIGPAASCQ
jgi:hypothetical protein